MVIAGLDIEASRMMDLALGVNDRELEIKLRHALEAGERAIDLTIAERETILRALDDESTGELARLRVVLLQERDARSALDHPAADAA